MINGYGGYVVFPMQPEGPQQWLHGCLLSLAAKSHSHLVPPKWGGEDELKGRSTV